ncbi:TetR/AcrR family transcriptional regulator [Mycolicibacterium sp. P9-64]|uniref:TetR/AcrR family transcriptional regulator n=1 Tax=Mycolicibacterium sp. P9-64 TaxID=2024612 RepID=UPI0011EDE3D1|nr:TetR/AcrR family transcriptional regulator [Mycolicibacterium sp. P9-64]KAA0078926.1 TetR/AcrR family transcriptional regulator [Mycolicibacterium sp. P9-64]
MTEQADRRAEATRLQILQAAAHQFATRPYSRVNLDDILASADVTKGALYFHFRSKHALANAVIEYRAERGWATVEQLRANGLSGLETTIDVSYLIAVSDIGEADARAGLNLLEAVGRFDGLQAKVLDVWVGGFAAFTRRAIGEGDVVDRVDPEHAARLLVSMYLGLRQTSNLDEPETFLRDLESMWLLVLPGFANPEKLDYFVGFIRRRTALAVKNTVPLRANNL